MSHKNLRRQPQPQLRLIVVKKNALELQRLVSALQPLARPYNVVVAGYSSSVNALEAIRLGRRPLGIVTGHNFAGITGLNLHHAVREMTNGAAIPVVINSGYKDVRERVENLRAHGDDNIFFADKASATPGTIFAQLRASLPQLMHMPASA